MPPAHEFVLARPSTSRRPSRRRAPAPAPRSGSASAAGSGRSSPGCSPRRRAGAGRSPGLAEGCSPSSAGHEQDAAIRRAQGARRRVGQVRSTSQRSVAQRNHRLHHRLRCDGEPRRLGRGRRPGQQQRRAQGGPRASAEARRRDHGALRPLHTMRSGRASSSSPGQGSRSRSPSWRAKRSASGGISHSPKLSCISRRRRAGRGWVARRSSRSPPRC
jgi:hypothetical protein